jgi:two-component system, OmpR family, sensor histidine kinase MtrB
VSRAAAPPAAVVAAVAWVRGQWDEFTSLWRRSLQLRVVASTLALSSVMLLVLGLILQTQITDGLLQAKITAAVKQAEISRDQVAAELVGVDLSGDDIDGLLGTALNRLSTTPGDAAQDSATSGAGTFAAVLVDGGAGVDPPHSGPLDEVPDELAAEVLADVPGHKIHTVRRDSGEVTLVAVGMPVPTPSTSRSVQLYLLFPLTGEQQTLLLVQNTLLLGGLLLTLLLAGIASLVTRQVVTPVRQAAEVAERFAEGDLDERMPVAGEDDVARLAVSFNEMAGSIQRQIRQLEEFGALQRRFTSDVSHELRTPLTTVRMAADTLHDARDGMPPTLARSTELLVDELDRFESLLGDLLEISRLDAGVAELATETLDLRGVVRTVVDSVRPLAASNGTDIQLRLPASEVTAEFDPRRVARILRNLLGNALDHGEGRPVLVYLGADDHAVAVLVRDYGVGLRLGEGELVFNRFWRADPSRNRRTGGTGLGLSISLEDAKLHGGWLDVWGEPGAGAAFRLTMPRLEGTELTHSPVPMPDEADSPGVLPEQLRTARPPQSAYPPAHRLTSVAPDSAGGQRWSE